MSYYLLNLHGMLHRVIPCLTSRLHRQACRVMPWLTLKLCRDVPAEAVSAHAHHATGRATATNSAHCQRLQLHDASGTLDGCRIPVANREERCVEVAISGEGFSNCDLTLSKKMGQVIWSILRVVLIARHPKRLAIKQRLHKRQSS